MRMKNDVIETRIRKETMSNSEVWFFPEVKMLDEWFGLRNTDCDRGFDVVHIKIGDKFNDIYSAQNTIDKYNKFWLTNIHNLNNAVVKVEYVQVD